tara:strand:- start:11685 stop:11861 length:177 start_codon:yes stop_codon:yes gene_type:complete
LLWFLLPVENHCAFFSGLEMLQPINFSYGLVKFGLSLPWAEAMNKTLKTAQNASVTIA